MDELKLLKRCQSGEKAAFQELIAKYHPYVYRFLLKMTEDQDVSEDLAQETFVKVIRSIEKFDIYGKAKFSTYIITLCKNTYIDYYRKQKKYVNNVPIEDNLTAGDINMEETVIDSIYSKSIAEEIEKLPEEQKIVIKLKYLEGLTLKEIGEKLELQPKTVKSRIHNGIVKLRKYLEG